MARLDAVQRCQNLMVLPALYGQLGQLHSNSKSEHAYRSRLGFFSFTNIEKGICRVAPSESYLMILSSCLLDALSEMKRPVLRSPPFVEDVRPEYPCGGLHWTNPTWELGAFTFPKRR